MKGLRRLFPYLSPYRSQIFGSIVFHVLSAIFTVVSIPLIIPFFQILFQTHTEPIAAPSSTYDLEGQLTFYFDQLIQEYSEKRALLVVCISISVVFFLKNLTRYLASFFMIPVRSGIVADIRMQLFSKYLDLPLSFFSEEKKGNLLTRISTDIQEIETSVLQALEAAFKSPFIMIGSLTFMIYISPSLTIFVLVLLVFVVFIIGGVSRRLRQQSSDLQEEVSDLLSLTEESLGGIKVIKAYRAESLLKRLFINKNNVWKSLLNQILRRRDLSSPFSEFLGVSVVAVLMYYGSSLVFQDRLNPSAFFAFIFAFYQIIEPSKVFANAYYNIQKGLASVDRIESILKEKNPIREKQGNQILHSLKTGIEFRNVHFNYAKEEQSVIKNLSVTIPANKTTAIVGLSGAGKTTLIDLINRFYDCTSGEILMDNINIQDFKLDSLRSMIALITQEAFLFNDTIENNILFGTQNKTLEDVKKAAKLAYADTFIENSANGYQTIIGDRGVKLSGGQRQRITLARAILKNPPIFIFDEATSALDSESEKRIQLALDDFLQDRTAIIIAHRLSTIKKADQILVLNNGQLVEKGTHEELITLDGEYSKFVDLQSVSDK